MALIVCKNCGKKISDTVEKCVHCGALQKETIVEKSEKSTSPKKDFFYYSKEEKAVLEKQFIKSDEWAFYYKNKEETFKRIKSLIGLITKAFFVYFIVMSVLMPKSPDAEPILLRDTEPALLGFMILAVAWILSMIVLIIISILSKIQRESIDRIIYHKKFQKWLYENHGITYEPIFDKDTQQKKFDNYNIEELS